MIPHTACPDDRQISLLLLSCLIPPPPPAQHDDDDITGRPWTRGTCHLQPLIKRSLPDQLELPDTSYQHKNFPFPNKSRNPSLPPPHASLPAALRHLTDLGFAGPTSFPTHYTQHTLLIASRPVAQDGALSEQAPGGAVRRILVPARGGRADMETASNGVATIPSASTPALPVLPTDSSTSRSGSAAFPARRRRSGRADCSS